MKFQRKTLGVAALALAISLSISFVAGASPRRDHGDFQFIVKEKIVSIIKKFHHIFVFITLDDDHPTDPKP